jgi:hypothetical protein
MSTSSRSNNNVSKEKNNTTSINKLDGFCNQVLKSDKHIRFVGLANNIGTLLSTAYREQLIPLMNKEETAHYAIKAILRAATREDFEDKTGRLHYSIGKYERLIRATVPIIVKDYESSKFYLLLSFDVEKGSDVISSIIENKILPLINENKEFFS